MPFVSPPELAVTLTSPHRGEVRGMGIPAGVTLIVGGGFHGKSTLLDALQCGVYNHLPGDGREYVVTVASACKVRAEDGRSVEKVDISPFISNLPTGQDTRHFETENASGSTSQASSIIESLEVGCRLLLLDEDTSATNFMIRDRRMQELVHREKEPITPFIDRVRRLLTDCGVSTILVMGGSGDYFDTADTVIMMDGYRPSSVTARAREIARLHPVHRKSEGGGEMKRPLPRLFHPPSIDPSRGRRPVKIDTPRLSTIHFGRSTIELGAVEQLVDRSQSLAAGWALHHLASRYFKSGMNLCDALDALDAEVAERGVDILLPWRAGSVALPRMFEIAAVLNRLRGVKVLSPRD